VKVWRYVDFAKYVHLLHTQRLFFARADRLAKQDPFEGSYPSADKERRVRYYQDIAAQTPAIPSGEIAKMVREDAFLSRNMQKDTFISCWHASFHESAAMWKLYGETNRSIAIQTTFEKLQHGLEGRAALGLVQYIDYENESMFTGRAYGAVPFLFKRRSFEHEHELRAIIQRSRMGVQDPQRQYDDSEIGIEREVQIDQLIELAIVSPTSELWFLQLVKEVTARLGFQFAVLPSSLNADPVF